MSNDRIASAYIDPGQLNGITENAAFPNHINRVNYKPRSLVDETLEFIDPIPNIHSMFVQFNERFFWNKLLSVQVRWSNRMTSCAGICSFSSRNRECIISLSSPLLKLRPRKDLVQTLLHEMIHAYLFLTNNNRDRSGHGPEFCKHMDRINSTAGTHITIYHSFHDEVNLYKQHWWRCNGPCQKKRPFYGIVRRSMNRAPGPSDFWYEEHQQTCGGQFTKIKEPENTHPKKSKESPKLPHNQRVLDQFIISSNPNSPVNKKSPSNHIRNGQNSNNIHGINSINSNLPKSSVPNSNFVKLGNKTNNVFGFGTGGPGSSKSTQTRNDNNDNIKPKNSNAVNFVGVLGGRPLRMENVDNNGAQSLEEMTTCPVCSKRIPQRRINVHLDLCLIKTAGNHDVGFINLPSLKRSKNSDVPCKKPCLCHQPAPNANQQPQQNIFDRNSDVVAGSSNASQQPQQNFTNENLDTAAGSANVNQQSKNLVDCPNCIGKFRIEEINAHLDVCLNTSNCSQENIPINDSSDDTLDYITCPACDKNILLKKFHNHSQKCIEEAKRTRERPIVIIDGDENEARGTSKEYKCFVCDQMINIPLDKHLEICIKIAFDSDDDVDDGLDVLIKDELEKSKGKILCPICEQLIDANLMGEHVDECIKD